MGRHLLDDRRVDSVRARCDGSERSVSFLSTRLDSISSCTNESSRLEGKFHEIKSAGYSYQKERELTISTVEDDQTSLALEVSTLLPSSLDRQSHCYISPLPSSARLIQISEFNPHKNETLPVGHVFLADLPSRPAGVVQLRIGLLVDQDVSCFS